MLPTLTLAGREFSTYSLMAMIGMIAAGLFAYKEAETRALRPVDMIELLLVGAVGTLFGAHLLYFLLNIRLLGKVPFLELIGGAVFYGGLFGGLLFGLIFLKVKKWDVAVYADIAACFIPLFHGIARIGCFLGGCCYGIECKVGFVMIHSPAAGANGVSRFPVQLLEAALEFGLFALIYLVLYHGCAEKRSAGEKSRLEGHLLNVYLVLYAVIRFLDEFLRGDDALRGIFGPFSTSQWISLAVLAVHAVYFGIKSCRKGTLQATSARGKTAAEQAAKHESES